MTSEPTSCGLYLCYRYYHLSNSFTPSPGRSLKRTSPFSVTLVQREWVFGYQTTTSASIVQTPAQTLPLIYYVEALCVLAALKLLCVHDPHQKLLIYTDNTNIVDIFSSLHCHPEFNTIVKHAVSTRVESQIDVRVLHIPGNMNGVADAISRAEFDHAKMLAANLSIPSLSILNFPPPLPIASPPHTSSGASEK